MMYHLLLVLMGIVLSQAKQCSNAILMNHYIITEKKGIESGERGSTTMNASIRSASEDGKKKVHTLNSIKPQANISWVCQFGIQDSSSLTLKLPNHLPWHNQSTLCQWWRKQTSFPILNTSTIFIPCFNQSTFCQWRNKQTCLPMLNTSTRFIRIAPTFNSIIASNICTQTHQTKKESNKKEKTEIAN